MKAAFRKIRLPVTSCSKDPVESDLHARLLLLEEGTQRFLLVQLELTSLQPYVIEHLKSILSDRLSTDPDHIWITVSHTFSAPHTRSLQAIVKDPQVKADNEAFCSMLYDSVNQAASVLEERLQTVRISFQKETCQANVNRDLPTEKGWWKGENPAEFSSPDLPVVVFQNNKDEIIGVVAAYDLQSSWMQTHCEDNVISADLFGKAMSAIEQDHPNLVCLLLFGCGGDQMPDSRFALAKEAAREITRSIEAALTSSARTMLEEEQLLIQVQPLLVQTKTILPTWEIVPQTTRRWQQAGEEVLEMHLLQIGPLLMIGVAPELNSITGHQIRSTLNTPMVLAACMVNGCAKYLPDEKSYDRVTYEAQNSRYMPGTAEQITAWLKSRPDRVSDPSENRKKTI